MRHYTQLTREQRYQISALLDVSAPQIVSSDLIKKIHFKITKPTLFCSKGSIVGFLIALHILYLDAH